MSESKPCGCCLEPVNDETERSDLCSEAAGTFDGIGWRIEYCPLHATAPTNAELARIGRELAGAVLAQRQEHEVLAETVPNISQWLDMVELARRFMKAAELKKKK